MTRWMTTAVALVMGVMGCGGGEVQEQPGAGDTPGARDAPLTPGSTVTVTVPTPPAVAKVQALLDDAMAIDSAGLAAEAAVTFVGDLGYDPLQAAGLDLIDGSALALTAGERSVLQDKGFAILDSDRYPTFFYAYLTIYGEDLPVYVSADSILDALHRSFDDILLALERAVMREELLTMLREMRTGLVGNTQAPARDAELFLAVAEALLTGQVPADLSAGVTTGEVSEFVTAAAAAQGILEKELFGIVRAFDFSQFKPRGHYEGDPAMEQYFRAMMWLGRIDFRMLESKDGKLNLRRRQLEAALMLRELMPDASRERWERLDTIVSAFVGEHDYMILPELDALIADLGIADSAALATVTDDAIAQAILNGGYGAQRISSHVMVKGGRTATLPLSRSFAFFGQRYTVDSHVFSNVVFDRAGGGSVKRWLPDPLDAAYAALGNDQAVGLLADELATHAYAGDLASMRRLVDEHDADYWDSSLYTLWLSALRTLSPPRDLTAPEPSGLPTVAKTEAWGRRLLNTQLGSWSQLRHDTLLYVKQSYTVGTVCEFPDAYVDPYPELFAAIARFAERGQVLIGQFDLPAGSSGLLASVDGYFAGLGAVAMTLQEMAEHQRTGTPHTSEHLAFINDVVNVTSGGSGPPSVEGWYAKLFFDRQRALELDPIIADVHTDPGGVERPAKVLHVGTSEPRAMVVTVDTCSGPRAYVGPVFAYHEVAEAGLNRITDSEWQTRTRAAVAEDVEWLQDVIAQ